MNESHKPTPPGITEPMAAQGRPMPSTGHQPIYASLVPSAAIGCAAKKPTKALDDLIANIDKLISAHPPATLYLYRRQYELLIVHRRLCRDGTYRGIPVTVVDP